MTSLHALACISHTLCSKAGQTISSDGSEANEGKVCRPCREGLAVPDDGTDVSIYPVYREKARITRPQADITNKTNEPSMKG